MAKPSLVDIILAALDSIQPSNELERRSALQEFELASGELEELLIGAERAKGRYNTSSVEKIIRLRDSYRNRLLPASRAKVLVGNKELQDKTAVYKRRYEELRDRDAQRITAASYKLKHGFGSKPRTPGLVDEAYKEALYLLNLSLYWGLLIEQYNADQIRDGDTPPQRRLKQEFERIRGTYA